MGAGEAGRGGYCGGTDEAAEDTTSTESVRAVLGVGGVVPRPSCVGKTEWVRSMCWNEGGQLLELNCAGGVVTPNLREYKYGVHTHILFDECSPQCVLQNRKLFQGGNSMVQLGQSPVNKDCYSVCLMKVKLYITSNT
eukprot:6079794-Prorocentrum_lima.AAC.1